MCPSSLEDGVERLPEPLHRRDLQPLREARALPVRLRDEDVLEAELLHLRHAPLDPAHRPHLAAEPDLAVGSNVRVRRPSC